MKSGQQYVKRFWLVRGINRVRFVPTMTRKRYAGGRAENCIVDIDDRLRETALHLVSLSGASSTWKQTRVADNKVKQIEEEFEVDLKFPWSARQLNTFICCCSEQQLKFSTINCYVSQVRKLHTLEGMKFSADNPTARLMLKGMANTGPSRKRRIAVSPFLLKTLRSRLYTSGLPKEEVLLIWCISLFLFFGAFRASEILSPAATSFSDTTLLSKHAVWNVDGNEGWMKLTILGPKEATGREKVEVEILSIDNKYLCPIESWRMWREYMDSRAPLQPNLPLFSFRSGKLPTATWLNAKLKWLLRNDIHYEQLQVLTHSFRAGLVTALARMGVNEEKIKVIGRWRSNAWKNYAKCGRSVRWEEMRMLSGLVTSDSALSSVTRIVVEDGVEW